MEGTGVSCLGGGQWSLPFASISRIVSDLWDIQEDNGVRKAIGACIYEIHSHYYDCSRDTAPPGLKGSHSIYLGGKLS